MATQNHDQENVPVGWGGEIGQIAYRGVSLIINVANRN